MLKMTNKKSITLFLLITTIILIGLSTVSAEEVDNPTNVAKSMQILHAPQNTHQLTEDTYSTYFDENSNLKEDSIEEGDTLDLSGTISNRNFTITKSLTLTSSQHNGKIINGTIRVNGVNGITITNLNITNGDDKVHPLTRGSGIIINQTNNSVIKNNYIVIQQQGDALCLARTINSTIENNYMVTLYYHTSATASSSHSVLVLLGANYTNINNNTVLSEGSNSIYASPWSTTDLPPAAGNSFYINITNNYVGCLVDNIGWYNGITIGGSFSNIINNTVVRAGTGIVPGIEAVVTGNKLYNVTTGISAGSFGVTCKNDIITGNYINNSVRSGTTTGIGLATDGIAINNTIIDVATGISISANAKNILVEGNSIIDDVMTTTAGITSGTGKVTNLTITNNTVIIKGPNAVKVNGTTHNVTDNYLYSSVASGNAAVIAPEDAIIEDNTPIKHLGFTSTNHNVTFGLTYDNQPQQGTISYKITNNANKVVKSGKKGTDAEGLLTIGINDIPVGKYNIEASYEDLSIKGAFTKKYDVIITAENTTINYGETVNITVTVKDENGKPVTGGKVTLREGGTSYSPADVINGTAQIRFSGNAWTHNCNITYNGYENYDAGMGQVTIDVLKIGLTYIFPNKIAKPGDEVEYTVEIRDENGKPISYVGYFYVEIDGENLTDTSGNAEKFRILSQSNITFTITASTDPKITTIKVIFPYDNDTYYSGGPNYLNSIGVGNLVVTDKEIANIYYNTSGTDYYYLTAKVFENKTFTIRGEYNSNGKPYSGYSLSSDMTLYIDDDTLTVPIKWGDGKFNITGLSEGNYTLKGQISDDEYASAITVGRLEVFKYDTSLKADIFYGYAGSEVVVPVTVTAESNQKVKSGTVILTINEKQFSANVKNGVASVNVTLPVIDGSYDVDLQYISDNDWFYNGNGNTYATAMAFIPPANPITISVPNVTGNLSGVVTIPITVTKGDEAISTGDVIVKIQDSIVFATVNNGIANVEFKLPATVGEYPLAVTYTNGVDTATGSGIVVVVNETKTESKISLNIKKEDEKVSLSGKLTDNETNPIEGLIYITLISSNADVTVYNTTSKNDGTYNLTLSSLSGEYDVESSFNGNDAYYSSTSGVKHFSTVITNKTDIEAPNLNAVYGDKNQFIGVVTDEDGNPIAGHHVALNLTRLSSGASKIYWVTTDYEGKYTLDINLAPGNYTARTVLDESGYVGDTVSYINIAKPTEVIQTAISSGNYSIKRNAGESFSSRLYTVNGGGLGGENVNLILANSKGQSKTYTLVTSGDGTFSIPINLAVGSYTVVCSFSGTTLYESSTSTSTIVVYE